MTRPFAFEGRFGTPALTGLIIGPQLLEDSAEIWVSKSS